MQVNLKAQKQNHFDAIVVGSGMSGGWAALELCRKGLKVLMIERGRNVEHVKDYPTAMLAPWEYDHRGKLTPDIAEKYAIQNRNYGVSDANKHFFVDEKESPYVQTKNDNFVWVRGHQIGGRTLLWGRHVYRWSDLDFMANAKEGVGVDFPIRYRDLESWYTYVEKFIGVSGQNEGIHHVPDSVFFKPFEMNCVEESMKAKIEKKYRDRKLIHARVTNITEPKPDQNRANCQSRNQCSQGCPFGGYFSSNSSTIPMALATGNLTIRTDAIATQVLYNEKTQKARGVEVLDTVSLKTEEYTSDVLFLNASTIPTTMLLQASTSSRFPNGFGNDSGALGKYLMTHTKIEIDGKMEGFSDVYQFGRRPAGVYIPRFRNIDKNDMDFLRGYNFQGAASRPRNNAKGFEGFGAELKEHLSKPADHWNVGFSGFGEQLPYEDNTVSLSKTVTDKWGLPVAELAFEWKENELKMCQDMVEQGMEMLAAAGVQDLKSEFMENPKTTAHEMGTARMGSDPRTSVVNVNNQMHAVKNVFITDGAAMGSNSCMNPSLTYMALTARAVDFAVAEKKKGNL